MIKKGRTYVKKSAKKIARTQGTGDFHFLLSYLVAAALDDFLATRLTALRLGAALRLATLRLGAALRLATLRLGAALRFATLATLRLGAALRFATLRFGAAFLFAAFFATAIVLSLFLGLRFLLRFTDDYTTEPTDLNVEKSIIFDFSIGHYSRDLSKTFLSFLGKRLF